MSNISFDNVYLLFIAIPLVVLLVLPFALAVRKDNASGHNIASCVLHVLMAVLIAFGAAGTSIVTVMTETDVYVVADVSYSANSNLDTIDSYIEELSHNLPNNSRMGVVCYGKTPKLLTRLGAGFTSVKEADVDDSETNTVSALEYTGKLFKDGVIKRIVLITDGADTDSTDSGALRRAVESLNSSGIYVDAIFLDDNITDATTEVQVSAVSYSQSVYLNHEETVSVTVQSSVSSAQNFKISLYKDGVLASSLSEAVSAGSNIYTFALDTSETGTFDYEVLAELDGDKNPYNNSLSFTQQVAGNVNILLITDKVKDEEIIEDVYGDYAEIDSYISNPAVPCTVEELCLYDEIIISDVDVSTLNSYRLFLSSLDTVVSLFGKSLVTFGNTGVHSCTDGSLKTLDDMLPVRFGQSDIDKKLTTIVIDTSKSMFMNGKLAAAKEAACKIVDLLDSEDQICIVTFDGDYRVPHNPSAVGDGVSVKDTINNLTVRQGTLIGGGLNAAYEKLKESIYKDKEVILITDGFTFSDDPENAVEIAQKMAVDGIKISVLDAGQAGKTGEVVTAAQNLINDIARVGQGKVISISSSNVSEALNEFQNDLQQKEYDILAGANVSRSYDDVLEGIDSSLFADDYFYIDGFIISRAKANAYTVMTTAYYNQDGKAKEVPLYAHWTYGNGKAASLATSLAEGIDAWRGNGLADKFLYRVLAVNTPASRANYPFTMEVLTDGAYTTVMAMPAVYRYDAQATIAVSTPDGATDTMAVAYDSESYSYRFISVDTGKYTVSVTYSYDGADYVSEKTFYISYPAEYDSFTVYTASPLHRMLVGSSGTVSEDGKLVIENREDEIGVKTVGLAAPLMIAVVVLFAVDIVIRKLKWNDIKSLFVKVNK